MTEIELINRYNFLKKRLKEADLNLNIENNAEIHDLKNKTELELGNIVELFKACDNSILKMKLHSFSGILVEIIKSLKYNVNGIKLSLNQGMMFPNYLFFKLIQDINYAFQTETGGYPIPYLFYEIGSTFNHEELKQLITEIQTEYNAAQISDYPTLYELHEKSIDKIIELSSKYN